MKEVGSWSEGDALTGSSLLLPVLVVLAVVGVALLLVRRRAHPLAIAAGALAAGLALPFILRNKWVLVLAVVAVMAFLIYASPRGGGSGRSRPW